MTDETINQFAVQEGFSAAAIVDTGDIVFDPTFRPCCEKISAAVWCQLFLPT